MASPKSKVTKVKVEGPLAPFVDPYRSRLKERGYTPLSIVNELRQLAHLSRWLEERRMTGADLTRGGSYSFSICDESALTIEPVRCRD